MAVPPRAYCYSAGNWWCHHRSGAYLPIYLEYLSNHKIITFCRRHVWSVLLFDFSIFRFSSLADGEFQQDAKAREPDPLPPSPSSLSLTSRDNEPLTLSQLSPRKIEPPQDAHPPQTSRSPTPARIASNKRPLSTVSGSTSSVAPAPKRGKTVAITATERGSSKSSLILQPSLRKNGMVSAPIYSNSKLSSRSSHHGKPRLGPQALGAIGKEVAKRKKMVPPLKSSSGSYYQSQEHEVNERSSGSSDHQGNSKQFKVVNLSTHQVTDSFVPIPLCSTYFPLSLGCSFTPHKVHEADRTNFPFGITVECTSRRDTREAIKLRSG